MADSKGEYRHSVSVKASLGASAGEKRSPRQYETVSVENRTAREIFLTVRFDDLAELPAIREQTIPQLIALAEEMERKAEDALVSIDRPGVQASVSVSSPAMPASSPQPTQSEPAPAAKAARPRATKVEKGKLCARMRQLLQEHRLTKGEYKDWMQLLEAHPGPKGEKDMQRVPEEQLQTFIESLEYVRSQKPEASA